MNAGKADEMAMGRRIPRDGVETVPPKRRLPDAAAPVVSTFRLLFAIVVVVSAGVDAGRRPPNGEAYAVGSGTPRTTPRRAVEGVESDWIGDCAAPRAGDASAARAAGGIHVDARPGLPRMEVEANAAVARSNGESRANTSSSSSKSTSSRASSMGGRTNGVGPATSSDAGRTIALNALGSVCVTKALTVEERSVEDSTTSRRGRRTLVSFTSVAVSCARTFCGTGSCARFSSKRALSLTVRCASKRPSFLALE